MPSTRRVSGLAARAPPYETHQTRWTHRLPPTPCATQIPAEAMNSRVMSSWSPLELAAPVDEAQTKRRWSLLHVAPLRGVASNAKLTLLKLAGRWPPLLSGAQAVRGGSPRPLGADAPSSSVAPRGSHGSFVALGSEFVGMQRHTVSSGLRARQPCMARVRLQ